MAFANYEIVQKIAESPQAAIYKAYHRKNPDRPLALKVLKTTPLSEHKMAHFRHKIEHLKVLNDPMAITPISLEAKDGICFITQDYFEGVTLDELIASQRGIPLDEFFTITCSIALALDKVHEAGIIHGGIKTHNIVVDRTTLGVRLIDFISAIDVRDVSHFIYDPSFIRGTLAYTSPEQTGRISHRVAFSSDLYSLGVVFYEMLTGRPPFYSDDPLELIHSHLAKEAPTVREVNPDIPLVLSNIVAKLMLKEPEKRYHSSSGLLADLVRCRHEYSTTGSTREFPLEDNVYARRVAFISKMVGRDSEASLVLDEYEQVARGAFRSMFISGLAGIGKTRLIQELQKPIVKHRGYFTSGKFDIYQKNIPYSSLTQALRNLIRTFLTESDQRISLWKSRILKAVDGNGKVLTDVIPELEVLIGQQPEVTQLPPVESLNRFNDVFDKFLTCLASEENPLTLFIDDLQWCDAASFDFLAYVFANHKEHPHLFFLGAYRDNEVDSSHPLSKLIRNVRQGNWPLKEIRLEPLRPGDSNEMVSYILDSPLPQTKELSDFISALTEGNPLFVSESLAFLYNERLLSLDERRVWQWDFERIHQSSMPTTVVGLFTSKIQKLPPALVTLLEYCACMGNMFDPAELALIREITLQETFEILKPALEQGLLMENRNQLQFIHDRVQEAALSGIPDERRRQIHRQIGKHMLAAIPEGAGDMERLDNLFTVVAHLNLGREENLDSTTAYFLSDMNFHSGNKALNSLATEAANKYFNLSRELLPRDCWDDSHYVRTFQIFQKAAKTELMCGDYENSQSLINELLDHARTDLDRVECLAEQTTSLSSFGNFLQAIETANRGLAYFGKAIPESTDEVDKKRAKLVAEIASKNLDIRKTFLNMPFTTDRKCQVEHAFYSELLADLYFSGRVPELYLIAAQATLHCLSAGMDEAVIYAFTAMAIYHAEHEEFEESFIYEDLTYDLAAKYPNTFTSTKCMTGAVVTLMHSRSHPRDVADYSLKAIQCGKSCGDLNNAGYSYGPLMWNLQVQGADLPVIEDYVKECLQFSSRYHLGIARGLAEAVQAGWVEPMKKDYAPAEMEGKLAGWERDNHIVSLGSYYVLRAQTHYYLGENEEAERCLVSGKKHLPGFSNSILKRQWHVLRVLNALSLYERGTGYTSKRKLMAAIRPIIRHIERWAALGPSLRPYLALLYAELERVTGDFREARSLYQDAINTAHEQGYTFLEGHLNERLGELLLKAGQHSARMHLAEASRLYRECRAERNETTLLERYSEWLEEETPTAPNTDTTAAATLPNLDANYLMKSAFVISAELEQDVLLKKIMSVVIESSGAQRGYLLIEDEGDLFVRAESHISKQQTAPALNQKLGDAEGICRAIVRYVQRTGERVILNNACQEGVFNGNPEVQRMQLRSVLCLPVVKQSKIVGILYLENRLADSVFTPEKTQMTELLTSQAAISIENARLLEEMKRTEAALRDRERFLHRLAELNPAMISVSDMVTGEPIYSSRDSLSLLGYKPEDVKDPASIIDHGDYDRAVAAAAELKTATDDRVRELEIRAKAADGKWRCFLTSYMVFKRDQDGTPVQSMSVARDITELKESEEEIKRLNESLTRRAVELEASNKELEAFSYSVSHDLRAPLRGIDGFSQAVIEDYADKLDEQGKTYLTIVRKESQRMALLIDDLLNLSRVTRWEMRRERVDLSGLAQTVAKGLQRTHPERRVEFDVAPGLAVNGDARLLRVALENLLGNAWKFTSKHLTAKIQFGFAEQKQGMAYFIRDDGAGFDMAYAGKLFGAFQRLHSEKDFDGSGIGLATVQRIIHRHGGRIWAEAKPEKGATFFFTLG